MGGRESGFSQVDCRLQRLMTMVCVKTTFLRVPSVVKVGEKFNVEVTVYNQCPLPQFYKVYIDLDEVDHEESPWWILLPHLEDTWRFTFKAPNKPGRYTIYAKTNQEAGEGLPGKKAEILVVKEPIENKSTLIINTTPQGAMCYVDGSYRGLTPVIVIVDPGEHEILLRKKGYEDYRAKIYTEPGKVYRFTIKLKEKPKNRWLLPLALGVVGTLTGVGIAYVKETVKKTKA